MKIVASVLELTVTSDRWSGRSHVVRDDRDHARRWAVAEALIEQHGPVRIIDELVALTETTAANRRALRAHYVGQGRRTGWVGAVMGATLYAGGGLFSGRTARGRVELAKWIAFVLEFGRRQVAA